MTAPPRTAPGVTGRACRWHEHGGREYTVGVEEELMLLDAASLELRPAGPAVVRAAADVTHVKAELRQCMVEIATDPCRSATDLLGRLVPLRACVNAAAASLGCRICGGGTHPFSPGETQPTTDDERYLRIMGEAGFGWRRALVLGTHVHVSVDDPDRALRVVEALLSDLPLLIVLGACSPFWSGADTGLASTRLALLAGVPRTGLPPAARSFDDYLDTLGALQRCGGLEDASQLWWDVRLQPRFGTVEVRVLDGQPCVRDTVALAGLVQALVRHHGRRLPGGSGTTDRLVATENRWQAVRHGYDAVLCRTRHGSGTASTLVKRLLEDVADDAEAVGASWALDHLASLARTGGRAAELRRRYARTHDITDVARDLVRLTTAG